MAAKALPPIWLLGLSQAPLGVNGAVTLLVVPQLLAGRHVPEPQIAEITALALVPGFCAFLLAPILDVRLSRRTYALGFFGLCALLTFAALMAITNVPLLGWLLFTALFAVQLGVSAAGGWISQLVAKEDESKLGAWFVVGNIGGFGLTSVVGVILLRDLPYALGAAILGLMVVAPLAVFAFIPAPGPDRRLARESFGQFFRDLFALVRRPAVLLSLVLFGLPAASFALTNTLGGLGRDYAASEQFVALMGGAGVIVAGVFGSLIVLPRDPAVYTLAMVGQNVFQSAAFATAQFVMFRLMGKDNPFAATQYALMLAAQGLPLSYMQVLDGHAYGHGGLSTMYLMDGGLGALACAALVLLLRVTGRAAAEAQPVVLSGDQA